MTSGDLTRLITVEAKGEVADLKNNINQMIGNLRETTRRNDQQDWLNTNLARMSGLMQGQRDLDAVAALIMSELTPLVNAQYGAFYLARKESGTKVLNLIASYGVDRESPDVASRFRLGQGLVGQAAVERKPILIQHAPVDYIRISSGLGSAPPSSVAVLPVLFENEVMAVIELASFHSFDEVHRALMESLMEMVGVTVNTITANTRTEELLGESRRLADELKARTDELQMQQKELRRSNAELEEKAELLARQNQDIEVKNSEIEQARQELEERANQLTMSSRYKSEFLANMSHELRTPLNSLLILARLMSDNAEGNLTERQVEYAETIHGAGSDLLQLINDILDLSKIEAGRMDVQPARIAVSQLVDYVEATFRPQTEQKGLELRVRVAPSVPAHLFTDEQRLQQVLRNLLSNSVKFTETGHVELVVDTVGRRHPGRPGGQQRGLAGAGGVLRGVRHRHRHRGRQDPDRVRGLPAGGRHHLPPLRRHRAGTVDQPGNRQAPRRRHPRREPARPRLDLHAVPPARGRPGRRRVFGSTGSLGYGTSPLSSGAAPAMRTGPDPAADPGTGPAPGPVSALDRAVRGRLGHHLRRREDPHRRRRHPQRLRPDLGPGTARLRGPERRERPGRPGGPGTRRRRGAGPDGRDDAGDGRLRHDGRDPRDRPLQEPADHRPDRQGHARRPREVDRGRRLGLRHQAGGHPAPADRHARMARRRDRRPARGRRPGPVNDAHRASSPDDGDIKILLVDDRPENLLALESILGSLGHELVTASSGEQALRAVLREDFAVILLDVRMPGMDGFEVAAHVRLRERSRDTPIIFLTAAGDGPHQTLRGYAAGAADYLTKPFDPWVLRAKVGVFAELHRKNRQLKEQAEMLRETVRRHPADAGRAVEPPRRDRGDAGAADRPERARGPGRAVGAAGGADAGGFGRGADLGGG